MKSRGSWNGTYENMRYDYKLNANSIVLDFGGFTGGFAEKIASKYGCKVYAYEAVNRYYQQMVNKNNPNIIPFNYGVSTANGNASIHVCDEGSAIGNYAEQKKRNDKNDSYQRNVARFAHEPPEIIKIRDVVEILNEYNHVDLLKINIEGVEYEILPRLIGTGQINKIYNIQVQFHDFVHDADNIHDNIVSELKKTHDLVFESMWNWAFFKKKSSTPYLTTGGGGMGNHIKKLISALRYHPESKGHLSYFNTIFKDKSINVTDPTIRYRDINTWRIRVLPHDVDIPNGFCKYTLQERGFSDCDTNGRNIDSEYLRIPISFRNKIVRLIREKLEVSDVVNDKVNNFINNYGNYHSIHLRTFKADNFINDTSSKYALQRHNDWVNRGRHLCLSYIESLPDGQIFVSSDSKSEFNYITSKFPNKKFIQYNIDKRNHTDDFVDLILLSKGDYMILNTISTFSEVAWYFGGCNEKIHLC